MNFKLRCLAGLSFPSTLTKTTGYTTSVSSDKWAVNSPFRESLEHCHKLMCDASACISDMLFYCGNYCRYGGRYS